MLRVPSEKEDLKRLFDSGIAADNNEAFDSPQTAVRKLRQQDDAERDRLMRQLGNILPMSISMSMTMSVPIKRMKATSTKASKKSSKSEKKSDKKSERSNKKSDKK